LPSQGDSPPPAVWLALARVSELRLNPVDLDHGRAPPLALAGLSASELERLQAITAPRRRAQFIAGRLLLRRLLRHLLPPARTFSVSASDQGPPRLEDRGHGVPPLHLALSHSGDWVCAAAAPLPVGLDLETTQGRSRPRDWLALAEMAGSTAERAALAKLTIPSEQGLFFLRLWTLKEAWFKQQARALDAALLPQLHTAQVDREALANACVWQTEDCTLALTWPTTHHHDTQRHAGKLPVHWMPSEPTGPGVDTGTDPETLATLPALARQAPQPWQVGLS
jgi:4'-phosphopantetheinyl transferase